MEVDHHSHASDALGIATSPELQCRPGRPEDAASRTEGADDEPKENKYVAILFGLGKADGIETVLQASPGHEPKAGTTPAVSTPLDRCAETETSPHLSRTLGRNEHSPQLPLTLNDRINRDQSSQAVETEEFSPRKQSSSSSLVTSEAPEPPSQQRPDNRHDGAREGNQGASSNQPILNRWNSKRRKEAPSESDSQSPASKKRPLLAAAASNGVQLAARFVGATIQNAFAVTIKAPVPERPPKNPLNGLSPPKRKLPSAADVARIRRLVHDYTLLDPLDRQDSEESRMIHSLTGYTLNPPLVSLFGPGSLRSPIRTRSGKLEAILRMQIDLATLEACKNRDQRLAEVCTQCRYQRSGAEVTFLHVPTGRAISPEQYGARYLVMLEQLCQIRSGYWASYFAALFAGPAPGVASDDVGPAGDGDAEPAALDMTALVGGASTRVLVDGDEGGNQCEEAPSSTRTVISGSVFEERDDHDTVPS